MTRAAHTPGPWHIGFASLCVYAGEPNKVDQPYIVRQLDTKNSEANARLIAAAPDMLAALESALVAHDIATKHLPRDIAERLSPARKTISSAIDKARGE